MTALLRARLAGATIGPLLLALAACGTSPPPVQAWRWDKPDTTDETFARDRYYCLTGATSAHGPFARVFGRTELDPERFVFCMALRGYTRDDAGRFGPPPEKPAAAPRR